MASENTIPPYENIDLDFIDIDFSFDDTENFVGETPTPYKNGENFGSEGVNQNNGKKFDNKIPDKKNGGNDGNTTTNQNKFNNQNISSQGLGNQTDYAKLFTTNRTFKSKDELVNYCKSIGKQVNMSFILCTYKHKEGNKAGIFYIKCERAGEYKPRNLKLQRATSTKKCQCPFKLKATTVRDGGWSYVVVEGRHNHNFAIYPEGHTAGKFKEVEYNLTSELTKSFMAPNDILRTLKRVTGDNSSIIKHVNNARQKLRTEEMEGRRPIQQFQKFLTENGYFQYFRKKEGTDILEDIFFMHPDSYKMLNAWPFVISLDCTYKTNRYELPLLEVVGFSPTWLTFTVAYCFLSSEKEESFVWALKNLRSFFISIVPTAILTDRELGLINAVSLIFPESKHMLCRRHIDMAIKSKALKFSGGHEQFARNFVFKWNEVISTYIPGEFDSKWFEMEKYYSRHPALLTYVKDTWLFPHWKRILSIEVDECMHFGSYTTNRVESEHHRVKRELKSHVATFDTIFRRLDKVMMLQIDAIKSSLEVSRSKKLTGLPALFDNIAFLVSHKAIKIMNKELQRNEKKVHGEKILCGCYFKRTHGLPCAHKLEKYANSKEGIPLTSIHDFWKKLDIEITSGEDLIDYDKDTYARVWGDLLCAPLPIRKRLFLHLREVLYPDSVNIKEPNIIQSKGRPKKKSNARNPSEWEFTERKYGISQSNSTSPTKKRKRRSSPRSTYIASIQSKPPKRDQCGSPSKGPPKSPPINGASGRWQSILASPYIFDLPSFITPFIQDFVDVESDGNCGYRAVAFLLWGDEDKWLEVREKCYKELRNRSNLYDKIFGNLSNVEDILKRIEWKHGNAPIDKWMTLPELGHVIATAYNIIFVSYGIHGGYTFLPIIVDRNLGTPTQTLVIGFINQARHFIALRMSDGDDYPLPAVAWYWEQEHDSSATHLITPYRTRFTKYMELMNSSKRNNYNTHVDLSD